MQLLRTACLIPACAQPRQRGSDYEGRFPPSPSDIYQTQLSSNDGRNASAMLLRHCIISLSTQSAEQVHVRCRNCKAAAQTTPFLACDSCRSVQPVDPSVDYFRIFGLPDGGVPPQVMGQAADPPQSMSQAAVSPQSASQAAQIALGVPGSTNSDAGVLAITHGRLRPVILSHLHFSTRFLGHCHPSRSCSLYTSFQILQGYPINFHGFLGVIPAVHAVIIHRDHPQIFAALGFEMMVAVRYAAGAGFYLPRPDRPPKLDEHALTEVMKKLFKNYKKWGKYLDPKSGFWLPGTRIHTQAHFGVHATSFGLVPSPE
uniref:Uncharacterized protein n=1 Tax=Vitis vinifera TaxID=29760 RepID=A5CA84_VITVI|nr:hypothetical protein VITISV_022162 [Vitis vinifera]